MKIYSEILKFSTRGEMDIVDLTGETLTVLRRSGVSNGLLHLYTPHTTGIISINENDSSLLRDVRRTLERLVPKKDPYEHPENAHSHLRSLLLSHEQTVPVVDGRAVLGTWQSILFIEADTSARQRSVVVQIIGE
jgi:secondary thiamine-phosphate synthase enzyme